MHRPPLVARQVPMHAVSALSLDGAHAYLGAECIACLVHQDDVEDEELQQIEDEAELLCIRHPLGHPALACAYEHPLAHHGQVGEVQANDAREDGREHGRVAA